MSCYPDNAMPPSPLDVQDLWSPNKRLYLIVIKDLFRIYTYLLFIFIKHLLKVFLYCQNNILKNLRADQATRSQSRIKAEEVKYIFYTHNSKRSFPSSSPSPLFFSSIQIWRGKGHELCIIFYFYQILNK